MLGLIHSVFYKGDVSFEVNEYGYKEWRVNGVRHREDGPAVEGADGYKEWWLNGEYHREDGPAIEYDSGNKAWWINGERLTEEEFDAQVNS